MNVLIVEDEALAVQKLTKLLRETAPTLNVVGVTDGIETTVEWLTSHPSPDLIMMDIELSDGQSFEIFNLVEVDCPVIFTTSYDEHALRAFKGNSLDYLLKPIRRDELDQAVQKYLRIAARRVTSADIGHLVQDLRKQGSGHEVRTQFLVREGQRLIPVETAQIVCFYAEDGQTYLLTRNRIGYTVEYTLEQLEEMLDVTQFFRVNEQFIVAQSAITATHSSLNGKLKLELKPGPGREVLVSPDRVERFRIWKGN
ncbi:LytR/AlgR family response regulator transcription factor [Tellurirhabdus rosea]|uniref:LytR/AlgR family response regulator transcription factor n=1 Tax=Tellurirhabdus rosea TaxID=2674997 RepID=UPI0022571385|nr:LytTR family DNA-binding domain-containing protein [Tellurirhabdus rosea]